MESRASWTPDIPWIRRKKQLELVEAKHAEQAERLRQVRAERGPEAQSRLRGWVEPGQVREDGERGATPSLIRAPPSQGAQRTEEAWASFQEQSGVLQVPPPCASRPTPLQPRSCGARRPPPPPGSPPPVLRPHSHFRQELQGKVMEAAAALDASRGGPEL